MKRLAPDFLLVKEGKGFVGIGDDTLPIEEHRKAAREGLTYVRSQALTRRWDVIILDEIWNALQLKLVSPTAVQDTIDLIQTRVEYLITTGRGCPQEFIDKADLVTEMKEVKHPFISGVKGKKGLEF
jgi:cob(I)alamin adenosyltransferase